MEKRSFWKTTRCNPLRNRPVTVHSSPNLLNLNWRRPTHKHFPKLMHSFPHRTRRALSNAHASDPIPWTNNRKIDKLVHSLWTFHKTITDSSVSGDQSRHWRSLIDRNQVRCYRLPMDSETVGKRGNRLVFKSTANHQLRRPWETRVSTTDLMGNRSLRSRWIK